MSCKEESSLPKTVVQSRGIPSRPGRIPRNFADRDRDIEFVDVAIIGGRCAGANLAAILAAAGLQVVILDRASFPSDRLSTHILQLNGSAALAEAGLSAELLATGAPALTGMDVDIDGIDLSCDFRLRPGDGPGAFCIRRFVLDQLLLDRAQRAGAVVRTETAVTGLIKEFGAVKGVVCRSRGREFTVRASLVVGADGRSSTLARLVGARTYAGVTGERFVLWTYVRPSVAMPPRIQFVRNGLDVFMCAPTDHGAVMVMTNPPLSEKAEAQRDPRHYLERQLRGCARMRWAAGDVARSVGRVNLVGRCDSFYRTAAGPGWVLAGDAGLFKDPCTGQGMSDALRHTQRLAAHILTGLASGNVDAMTQAWWRWRDNDEAQWFGFMNHQGRAALVTEYERTLLLRMSANQRRRKDLADVFAHRVPPLRAFPFRSAAAAFLDSATRNPRRSASIVGQAFRLGINELSWRWRLRAGSSVRSRTRGVAPC